MISLQRLHPKLCEPLVSIPIDQLSCQYKENLANYFFFHNKFFLYPRFQSLLGPSHFKKVARDLVMKTSLLLFHSSISFAHVRIQRMLSRALVWSTVTERQWYILYTCYNTTLTFMFSLPCRRKHKLRMTKRKQPKLFIISSLSFCKILSLIQCRRFLTSSPASFCYAILTEHLFLEDKWSGEFVNERIQYLQIC